MLELALYVVVFEFLDRLFSKSLKKELALEESSKKKDIDTSKSKT